MPDFEDISSEQQKIYDEALEQLRVKGQPLMNKEQFNRLYAEYERDKLSRRAIRKLVKRSKTAKKKVKSAARSVKRSMGKMASSLGRSLSKKLTRKRRPSNSISNSNSNNTKFFGNAGL